MEQKRTEGLATASLVLGILSFILLSIFGAIPAIICGHIAKSRIRKNPEELEGSGKATAGLILGYLHIVLLPVIVIVVGIMAAVAVPVMSSNTDYAIQTEAMAEIMSVSTAGRLYYVENGESPAHFEDLLTSELILPENIDGRYYTSDSGWETAVFNPQNGTVISVTLTDANGTTKTFISDPNSGQITVQ